MPSVMEMQDVMRVPDVAPKRKMLAHPIIRVLVDENPKRLGSSAYHRFAMYRDGMTVEEFFDLGGRPEDIRWDEERHYIKLERWEYMRSQAA